MPLAMVPQGETRVISDFHGADNVKRHLKGMGFMKGEQVRVLGENASGMILMVKDVRIALNRGLAQKIIVLD